ncbi:hypothetical protein [Desulfurispora thermophila]|uniref:hypothetical protein n=1 Tax=Desulfurispora thermophila TaxID=265470 RepID=UPI0003677A2A|nr:hypothetical protein [Desulfurispora thermophila]
MHKEFYRLSFIADLQLTKSALMTLEEIMSPTFFQQAIDRLKETSLADAFGRDCREDIKNIPLLAYWWYKAQEDTVFADLSGHYYPGEAAALASELGFHIRQLRPQLPPDSDLAGFLGNDRSLLGLSHILPIMYYLQNLGLVPQELVPDQEGFRFTLANPKDDFPFSRIWFFYAAEDPTPLLKKVANGVDGAVFLQLNSPPAQLCELTQIARPGLYITTANLARTQRGMSIERQAYRFDV